MDKAGKGQTELLSGRDKRLDIDGCPCILFSQQEAIDDAENRRPTRIIAGHKKTPASLDTGGF